MLVLSSTVPTVGSATAVMRSVALLSTTTVLPLGRVSMSRFPTSHDPPVNGMTAIEPSEYVMRRTIAAPASSRVGWKSTSAVVESLGEDCW